MTTSKDSLFIKTDKEPIRLRGQFADALLLAHISKEHRHAEE
jgi:hypothetical protein